MTDSRRWRSSSWPTVAVRGSALVHVIEQPYAGRLSLLPGLRAGVGLGCVAGARGGKPRPISHDVLAVGALLG
jgi:hypothetical protein